MTKQLYAIGFKKWVEVRSAIKPPKQMVSKVVKPVTYTTTYFDHNDYAYHNRPITKKVTIKVTSHIGGSVVKTVKTDTFYKIIGKNVADGAMIQLTDDQTKSFVEWLNKGIDYD